MLKSTVVTGSKTNAQLGDTVATLGSLPAGRYLINAVCMPTGTVAAGDLNNVQLVVGSTTVGTLLMAPSANAAVASPPIWTEFTAATTVKATAVANASGASAVYSVTLVATPEALY